MQWKAYTMYENFLILPVDKGRLVLFIMIIKKCFSCSLSAFFFFHLLPDVIYLIRGLKAVITSFISQFEIQ